MTAAALPIAPGRVQARLWQALLGAEAPATAARLSAAAGTSFQTAEFRLKLWVGAGLVARTARRPRHYHLLSSAERSPMPPVIDRHGRPQRRPAPAYQRLWRVIRILRTFDLPQLRLTTSVSPSRVHTYVGMLQRTGYVRLQKLGNPQRGEVSRYVLVRNTGPHAPRETALKRDGVNLRVLIDGNTQEAFDIARGAPSERRKYAAPVPASASAALADGGVG